MGADEKPKIKTRELVIGERTGKKKIPLIDPKELYYRNKIGRSGTGNGTH